MYLNTILRSIAVIFLMLFLACSSTIPGWYSEIPTKKNMLTAATTALSKDMQTAVDKAKQSAIADIASQMETHIAGLSKRFNEETGFSEDSELSMNYSQVTKSVIEQLLMGTRIDKQKIVREKDNVYRAFVLVSMPIGKANEALLNKIKANKTLYTKFQASQAFKELEKELNKTR